MFRTISINHRRPRRGIAMCVYESRLEHVAALLLRRLSPEDPRDLNDPSKKVYQKQFRDHVRYPVVSNKQPKYYKWFRR